MSSDRFDHVFIEPLDFEASLAFYRDALGWQVQFSWGEPGSPRGAGLSSGQMTVVLAEDHPADDKSKSHGVNGTRPTLHLAVEDIEARYAEVALSGRALFPPQLNHWGTKWFVAKDPDGNLIAFEQRTSAQGAKRPTCRLHAPQTRGTSTATTTALRGNGTGRHAKERGQQCVAMSDRADP